MVRYNLRGLKVLMRRFIRSDAGAATVDYVVLTALVSALGLAAAASISGGTESMSARIDTNLGSTFQPRAGASGNTNGGSWPVTGSPGNMPNPITLPENTYPDTPAAGDDQTDASDESDVPLANDAAEGDADGTGTDPEPGAAPPEIDPGEHAGGQPGSNGQSGSNPTLQEVDFRFEDLNIGCYWSNRAVSSWLTLNLDQETPFSVFGEGNPVAQNSRGKQAASGNVRWGSNIRVDVPPPGTSRTVYMQLGDRLGSFTVTRAACA